MATSSSVAGKGFRKSWADMHSDDSSMGASLPSMVKRKEGCESVQLAKGGPNGPASSFSVVCDDSYRPRDSSAITNNENKERNVLNSAFSSVRISKERNAAIAVARNTNDFSCFGVFLPKSDETFDADTRSRLMLSSSTEESRLGKRLLSAVSGNESGTSGGPSNFDYFSSITEHGVQQDNEAHATNQLYQSNSKYRKVLEDGLNKISTNHVGENNIHATSSPSPTNGDDDSQWQARFTQRERQIELTKGSTGYQQYLKKVPLSKRSHNDPQTPSAKDMCSKRQFDGKLIKWRKLLRQYDPNAAVLSDATCM